MKGSSFIGAMLAGCAAVAIGAPALAQNASATPAAQAPQSATDALMQDIVVTAQKKTRGETLQSVPIAASAFNSNQLQALQFRNIESITTTSPNVALDGVGTTKGTANFAIRGIGINSSVISTEPAVGTFIDGVYLGTNFGVVLDTFDIDSIEVLRGPQGVLFGRNVTGGVVSIHTKRPTGKFEINSKVSLESGLRGTGLAEVAASSVEGTLVNDTLFAKLTGFYSHDGGYFKGTTLHRNVGKDTTWFVRPTFVFQSGDFDSTLIMEHGEDHGDAPPIYNPGGTVNAKPFTSSEENPGYADLRYNSVTLESNLHVNFGDGKFTNIAGFREMKFPAATDSDGSPQDVDEIYYNHRTHQLSDEFRYAGKFFDFMDLVGGLYYFNQYINFAVRDDLGYINRYRDYGGKQHEWTAGAFLNADFEITKKLTFSAGGRYSKEHKHAQVVTGVLTPAPQLCNFTAFTCSSYPFDQAKDFSSFTPRFVLKYQFTPSVQAYASYAKGYRGGGFNLRNTAAAPPGPYNDEKADSFEVGLKGDFFNHRLRFNGALFTNTIHDAQRQSVVVLSTGSQTILGNAGNERVRGFEGDVTARLAKGFVVRGFVGYTQGEYTKVTLDINGDGVINDADKALKLPRLMPWTYGAGFTYDVETASGGSVTLQSDIDHRDASWFDDRNTGRLPKFDNLSASLAFSPGSWRDLRLSLYGKNLLDKVSLELNQPLGALPSGGAVEVAKKGRVIGIEATVKFH